MRYSACGFPSRFRQGSMEELHWLHTFQHIQGQPKVTCSIFGVFTVLHLNLGTFGHWKYDHCDLRATWLPGSLQNDSLGFLDIRLADRFFLLPRPVSESLAVFLIYAHVSVPCWLSMEVAKKVWCSATSFLSVFMLKDLSTDVLRIFLLLVDGSSDFRIWLVSIELLVGWSPLKQSGGVFGV